MKRIKTLTLFALLAVALVSGCPSESVGGDECFDDPTPCLRSGVSLAGQADWLIAQVESGADATEIQSTMDELEIRIEAWESCYQEYMNSID